MTEPTSHGRPATGAHAAGATLLLAFVLLLGALYNRFPLIFPDSGTYLGIAFAREYAIDRSSMYGFLLKPAVGLIGGAGGLWLAILLQALLVAAVIVGVARALLPQAPRRWLWLAALAPLTSLPWHAGQFMPDALTGPMILLVWLAARRDPGQPGTPLLWLLAGTMALVHYTHIVLFAVAAASTILLDRAPRAAAFRRGLAAAAITLLAVAVLVVANGTALKRWTMSPLGPAFLFARLNEDGLIPRWLDAHCGRDAPAALCAERNRIAADSQLLLWRDPGGIVSRHIWKGERAERWQWVAMMDTANRGAIAEQPLRFLASAASGALRQFATFQALDDECPENCSSTASGIGFSLARHRPGTVALLHRSRQSEGTLPRTLVRAITTPIAALALLLLLPALAVAWRRRDRAIASLAGATVAALLANAALAGALSDVHDRYQSRIVWLAPFVLLLAWMRWRDASLTPTPPARARARP